MVDAVPRFFDVAVQHRCVRAKAQRVGFPVNGEPIFAVGLVFADLIADFGMKDLGPAAGQAPQPRVDHLFEHPADRFFREVAEPVDLDRRPSLDVHLRERLVDHADHVDVPVERLVMVQPADDVNLGRPGLLRLQHPLADHFVGKRRKPWPPASRPGTRKTCSGRRRRWSG